MVLRTLALRYRFDRVFKYQKADQTKDNARSLCKVTTIGKWNCVRRTHCSVYAYVCARASVCVCGPRTRTHRECQSRLIDPPTARSPCYGVGLDCGGQGAVDERRRGRLDEETKHAIKTLITLKWVEDQTNQNSLTMASSGVRIDRNPTWPVTRIFPNAGNIVSYFRWSENCNWLKIAWQLLDIPKLRKFLEDWTCHAYVERTYWYIVGLKLEL